MDANGLPRLWVRFLPSDPMRWGRAAGSPRPTPWAALHHANLSYRPNQPTGEQRGDPFMDGKQ